MIQSIRELLHKSVLVNKNSKGIEKFYFVFWGCNFKDKTSLYEKEIMGLSLGVNDNIKETIDKIIDSEEINGRKFDFLLPIREIPEKYKGIKFI